MPNLLHFQEKPFYNMELDDAIRNYGRDGECLKVQTSDGIVYFVLDRALKKWRTRSTGEPRVCFTVSEIKKLLDAYPNPKMPETYNEIIRPLIFIKRAFTGSKPIK